MPGTLILPLDDSPAAEAALDAALRALDAWARSLVILAPPDCDVVLDEGFPRDADIHVQQLDDYDPASVVAAVRRAKAPVTVVLSFEALSRNGWLRDVTLELLHEPPANVLMARPLEPVSVPDDRADSEPAGMLGSKVGQLAGLLARFRGQRRGDLQPTPAHGSRAPAGRG